MYGAQTSISNRNRTPARGKKPLKRMPASFASADNIKSMAASLGIGLAAAVIVTALIMGLSYLEPLIYHKLPHAPYNPQFAIFYYIFPLGINLGAGITPSIKAPLLPKLITLLTNGTGGATSISFLDKSGTVIPNARLLQRSGVGLPGIALLIGVAFGAYMVSRHFILPKIQETIASCAIIGVIAGLVYLLFAALFPMRYSAPAYELAPKGFAIVDIPDDSPIPNLHLMASSLTWVTFLMAFLLAGLGALIGYRLGQLASENGNVFSALWRWAHRTRGFLRTCLEAFGVYFPIFFVYHFILYLVAMLMCFPSLSSFLYDFPDNSFFYAGSFGGFFNYLDFDRKPYHGELEVATGLTTRPIFNDSWDYPSLLRNFNILTVYIPIALFIIATLYIALRASVRNLQDRPNARWTNCWKAPVVTALFWLMVSVIVDLSTTNLSTTTSTQLARLFEETKMYTHEYTCVRGIAPWHPLIMALAMFIVEAVALSVGPKIVSAMPGLMKMLKGALVGPVSSAAGSTAANKAMTTPQYVAPGAGVTPQYLVPSQAATNTQAGNPIAAQNSRYPNGWQQPGPQYPGQSMPAPTQSTQPAQTTQPNQPPQFNQPGQKQR